MADGEDGAAFTVGGIGETGEDVFFGEFGEVGEDLLVQHGGSEPTQDVADGDAHVADAGAAAAFSGVEGDDGVVVHCIGIVATVVGLGEVVMNVATCPDY